MNGSLGEALTRAALNEIFPGKTFAKTRRPEWLNGLELDAYNEDLRIAFEYQGIQHYQYVPHFHGADTKRFEEQQERDQRKRQATNDEKICLFEISYLVKAVEIRDHVRNVIGELGYDIPDKVITDAQFVAHVQANNNLAAEMLEQAKAIAISHGGVCLSETYVDCRNLLKFRCAKDHVFESALADVQHFDHQRPRWCRICGGTYRRTDEENATLVASAGYELIEVTTAMIGKARKKATSLTVRCPLGHVYAVLRSNFMPVINGAPSSECITCSRTRTNRAKGKALQDENAEAMGLQRIGPYVGRHEVTAWQCLAYEEHVFRDKWNNINNRKTKRCPLC